MDANPPPYLPDELISISKRERRMEEKEKETTALSYLPEELITEILLRLPVKSLICFKCVSKAWFSLVSNPSFANSQFQITAATHTRRILFVTETSELRSIALDSLFTGNSAPTLLNPNFVHKLDFPIEIIGSCRGFIFLYSYPNIYLWNPSTGVHKQIPYYNGFSRSTFYGFGYDESKDDYLIVSISYIPNSGDVLSRLRIFSLRANAWNVVVSPTHFPCSEVPCSGSDYPVVESVFNGAIHWLAFRHEIDFFVAAFHLTERKLLEIPLPNDIEFWSTDYSLWVFRGFLSLWVLRFKDRVDIWVMKEYKVQSSWTKTLVLNMDTIPRISPICCTKSGDIIGTSCRIGLIRYDNEGEFLEHTYYCKGSTYVSIYTESLLSLPSVGEQD